MNFKNYDEYAISKAESWQVKNDSQGDFIWDSKLAYYKQDNLSQAPLVNSKSYKMSSKIIKQIVLLKLYLHFSMTS